MKRICNIIVLLLASVILHACSAQPRDKDLQPITILEPQAKATIWSASVTNAETALVYRFGVVQAEMDISPGKTWEYPVVVEITNAGKKATELYAYGPAEPPSIKCDFYVDGERLGYSPVVGDAVDSHITLKPGERFTRTLRGYWWIKTENKMNLSVGFSVVTKKEPIPEAPSTLFKSETKELRTAALPINFVKGEKQKDAQQPPERDK